MMKMIVPLIGGLILMSCSNSGSSNPASSSDSLTVDHSTPTLSFVNTKALGWTVVSGQSQTITFTGSEAVGATLKCRIKLKSNSAVGNYLNCGTIQQSSVQLKINDLVPSAVDGTYQIDAYLDRSGVTSPVLSAEIYIHSSLNAAATCPTALSDEVVFAKAAEYLSMSSAFDSQTQISIPTSKIVFANQTALDVSTLRRSFVMSSDHKLMVVKRLYASRSKSDCRNTVQTGEHRSNQGHEQQFIDCPYLVFNAAGQGVCLQAVSGAATYVRGIHSVLTKLDNNGNNRMFSLKTKDPQYAVDHPFVMLLPD